MSAEREMMTKFFGFDDLAKSLYSKLGMRTEIVID
jgi:hypothetical protein